jgi:hypothetical protein
MLARSMKAIGWPPSAAAITRARLSVRPCLARNRRQRLGGCNDMARPVPLHRHPAHAAKLVRNRLHGWVRPDPTRQRAEVAAR